MILENSTPDSSMFFAVPVICVAFHFFCDRAPGGFMPHRPREWYALLLRSTALISILLFYFAYSFRSMICTIAAGLFASVTLILARSADTLAYPSFIRYSGWSILLASLTLLPFTLLCYLGTSLR